MRRLSCTCCTLTNPAMKVTRTINILSWRKLRCSKGKLLQRSYQENNPQRGLLVFAEGRFNKRAKIWVHNFRQRGTTWGSINNLADIPYFASMQESRLLQLADLVAHAVWLLYEKRNPKLIRPLLRSFDRTDGTLHGLVHIGDSRGNTCECPACASRRLPGTFGKWVSAP